MKKLLLTLAAAVSVFAASAQTFTVSSVGTNNWALDATEKTLTGTVTATDGTVFNCVMKQNSSTTGINDSRAADLIKWYKGYTFTMTAPAGFNFEKIVFTASESKYTKIFTSPTGTTSVSGTDITWQATAESNVMEGTANEAQIRIKSMVITLTPTGSTQRADANLAFSATEVTGKVGTPFVAPTLTKDTDAPATYSSSNPEAATVDPTTGEVTLVAQGTTTITATTPATADFLAGEASYTLTVTEDFPRVVVSTSLTSNLDGWDATSSDAAIKVWNWDANYNCAKATGYIGGAKNVVEGSITSPAIDLSGYWDGQVVFDQAYKFFNNAAQTYLSASVSVDGGDFVPATVTNWPATEDFTWAKSVIDLSAYYGHSVKVKFTYTSTADVAGTWEIKNFTVKGRVAVAGNTEVEAADADAPATYYNMQGQPVNNPTNGLYIKVQGNKATKVIL